MQAHQKQSQRRIYDALATFCGFLRDASGEEVSADAYFRQLFRLYNVLFREGVMAASQAPSDRLRGTIAS